MAALATAYGLFSNFSPLLDINLTKIPKLPLTWALIIFLAAVAYIAIEGGYRLRMADRARHLQDAKERVEQPTVPGSGAKLIVRRVYLRPGSGIPSVNPAENIPWTIRCVLANISGSTAIIKRRSFAVGTFKELPPSLPYAEPTESTDSLGFGEEKEFSVEIDDDLAYLFRSHGIKASNMRHQRSSNMYFFGFAEYRDDLGISGGKLGVLRHYDLEAGRFETVSDHQYEFNETAESITGGPRLIISTASTLAFDDAIPNAYFFFVEIENTEIRYENAAQNLTASLEFQPIKGGTLKSEGAWKYPIPGSVDNWNRQITIGMGKSACLPLFYYFQNARPFRYYQLDARKMNINPSGILVGVDSFEALTFGEWNIRIKLTGDNVKQERILTVNLSPEQGPNWISKPNK